MGMFRNRGIRIFGVFSVSLLALGWKISIM
jgi:hypothetical protein